MGVNGDGHILDAPPKDQLFDEKNQQKYRETVHIVDINGRIMDSEENFTSKSDFSKSLPRNFFINNKFTQHLITERIFKLCKMPHQCLQLPIF